MFLVIGTENVKKFTREIRLEVDTTAYYLLGTLEF